MIEIVGIAAFVLNVVGNLLLARRSIRGWAVRIVSIVLWGVYAANILSLSLLLNAITFFGINCYGWWNWRRREGHADACKLRPCSCGRLA